MHADAEQLNSNLQASIMKMQQSLDEPPNPNLATFLVGKDSYGRWVVQEQQGSCGGFFVDRDEALKYARFENGNRPPTIIMVPGVLELNMKVRRSVAPLPDMGPPLRRVA